MHGELIYPHPASGEQQRVAGNATSVDGDTIRWELHDRGMDDRERDAHLAALEQLISSEEPVLLSLVESSPPLDEVESGPLAGDEHSAPLEYGVGSVDREKGHLTLSRRDAGSKQRSKQQGA